jgi:double-stranded uracil-DNA glycosylase
MRRDMNRSTEPRGDRFQISCGFPPIVGAGARLLILGSLPGRASLERGEYYAQPRNAFWKIMGEIFGAGPEWPYAERCARLAAQGVALWDVCAAAARPGSLDANIDPASVETNDFASLFVRHPSIGRVCCNGAAAHRLYVARVQSDLLEPARSVESLRLPSTSPAHAAVSYTQKLAAWRAVLTGAGV